MIEESKSIAPEDVSDKLRASSIRQEITANPCLGELVWFIQAMSLRPRGLETLAKDILDRFKHEIGASILPGKRERFSKQESIQIWEKIPYDARYSFRDEHFKAYHELDWEDESILHYDRPFGNSVSWANVPIKNIETARSRDAIPELTREALLKAVNETAENSLPGIIVGMCIDPSTSINAVPWFLPRLIECLFVLMDEYTKSEGQKMARTDVFESVSDFLVHAFTEKVMIVLQGPRVGKSFSAKAWCAMYPGKARLVPVPCGNRLPDLLRAIAEALGIEHRCRPSDLKWKVERAIRSSGLMLLFDDAEELCPATLTETSAAMRLNWIRSEIADRGLPCAMIVSPQSSLDTALKQYTTKDFHRFDKVFDRCHTFKIPNKIKLKEIVEITRFHFPELDNESLNIIAGRSKQQEQRGTSPLTFVEHLAKRARSLARKGGRQITSKEDIRAAMNESNEPQALPKQLPRPVQAPCTDDAAPEQTNRISARVNAGTETLIPA